MSGVQCHRITTSVNTLVLVLMERHSQIDYILLATRRYSSVLEVRFFRGGDYDTAQCLVDPVVRERPSANKQLKQNFYMERFNFEKLSEFEGEEVYEVSISN